MLLQIMSYLCVGACDGLTLVQHLKKIYNFNHQYLASTMALAGYSSSI